MRFLLLSVFGSVVALVACSSGDGGVGAGGAGTTTAASTSVHSVTSVTTGTGGTPDIGQPSDVYPAPHPAPPQVVDAFGPVLATPVVHPIFFQSDDPAMRTQLGDFTSQIGATNFWKETTLEYGVGAATSATPIVLDEVLPATIDDSAIQSWLAGKLNANDPALPVPDAGTLFIIYYPKGVDITLSGGPSGVEKSCQQFGGYHSNLVLDAAHGNLPVAYAVVPRCAAFNGFNGIDAVTAAGSHELIEAVTDPLPMTQPAYGQVDDGHIFWALALGGGETGDMCAQNQGVLTTFPELPFVVQRSWSNASAKAGHDPCVPRMPGQTYFAAAPVLPDNIDLGGFTAKGVKIPVGQTKTIDVKLFSDGPTAPFTVDAFESMFQGGGQKLAMSFDVDHGQNGQTLHLTIEALAKGQFGVEVFYLSARIGGQRNTWIGLVGN